MLIIIFGNLIQICASSGLSLYRGEHLASQQGPQSWAALGGCLWGVKDVWVEMCCKEVEYTWGLERNSNLCIAGTDHYEMSFSSCSVGGRRRSRGRAIVMTYTVTGKREGGEWRKSTGGGVGWGQTRLGLEGGNAWKLHQQAVVLPCSSCATVDKEKGG